MIIGSFVLPANTRIIPGLSDDEKIYNKTAKAYQRVCETIAQLQPETLVILTSGNIVYDNYFHISPRPSATGSMAKLGIPSVSVDINYDTAFVNKLCEYCNRYKFPACTLGEKDPSVDFSTMVPLYFLKPLYKDFDVVRISIAGFNLKDHYRLGMYIKEVSEELGRKTIVIAATDFSRVEASALIETAKQTDKNLINIMSAGEFNHLFDMETDPAFNKIGKESLRMFATLAGSLDKTDVISSNLSYDYADMRGFGICSYASIKEDRMRNFLEKLGPYDEYAKLAYEAIVAFVKNKEILPVPSTLPSEIAKGKGGVFVTIYLNGEERGHYGFVNKDKSLAEDIINTAIKAATVDSRFKPVSESELKKITVEVVTCSRPIRVRSLEQLNPRKFGLIVSWKEKLGYVMPFEDIESAAEQIELAKARAGIVPESNVYNMERFEAVMHH